MKLSVAIPVYNRTDAAGEIPLRIPEADHFLAVAQKDDGDD